jgi:type IV secretory pathway VirB6-like protein
MPHFLLLVLAVLVVMLAASHASAAETAAPATTQVQSYCDGYVGLTNRMAACIRKSIDTAAEKFFTSFYGMLQTAITAFMTLAVIVYGILLAYGLVERIGRDTMLLLLKVAAVAAFCSNTPQIYKMTIQAMDGAALAAVSYVPPSGKADSSGSDFSQNKCMQNMVKEQAASNKNLPVVGPWLGIDCLLDTVIGIKVSPKEGSAPNSTAVWYNEQFDAAQASKADNPGMARSLIFLFFSGVQSSIFGIMLGLAGFFFIAGLIMLIIRSFFTYIAGYLGIAVMVIVSPLFIPLVLFRETKVYFDKWVKLMISFALQPVLMLVFITFSLAAMDFAVLSGNYSVVYRMVGEASRAEKFDLNGYLTALRDENGQRLAEGATPDEKTRAIIAKKPRELLQVKTDVEKPLPKTAQSANTIVKEVLVDCSAAAIKADTTGERKKSCDANYPIKIWQESINWDVMAKARGVEGNLPVVLSGSDDLGQQIGREVFSALLFCAVVVFVLQGLLKIIPMVANDVLGDRGQSPDLGSAFSPVNMSGGGGGIVGRIQNMVKR